MKPFSFKERLQSFRYAINGIRITLWKEHNFRIHLTAAILVISLGFYLEVKPAEWLWLILAISMVFITEMINTALEGLVNLVEPNQNPLARQIKDIAAGAVLLSAIAALAIGVAIFWPYFCLLLS